MPPASCNLHGKTLVPGVTILAGAFIFKKAVWCNGIVAFLSLQTDAILNRKIQCKQEDI